jgi:hypothetical protein
MVCAWQEKIHGDENESLLCTTLDYVCLIFFVYKKCKICILFQNETSNFNL